MKKHNKIDCCLICEMHHKEICSNYCDYVNKEKCFEYYCTPGGCSYFKLYKKEV